MTTSGQLDELLQQIHADLRASWIQGKRRLVEEFLRDHPDVASHQYAALELAIAEYQLRCECGEAPTVEEYRARFPQIADRLEAALASQPAPPTEPADRTPGLATPAWPVSPTAAQVPPSTYAPPDTVDCPAPDFAVRPGLPHIPNYRIAHELGRGMAIVYKALDLNRQRLVALKTIGAANPRRLQRFKSEFRTLADIAHPNLVTLYEMVSDGETWFFTMELVDGVDFLSYVRGDCTEPKQSLTAKQTERLRRAFRQLVAGVRALHEAGHLHRDVKPSNVLVEHEGRVVVLDFGLSAELNAEGIHQSASQHIVGTFGYMAPEQSAAGPVGPAADWYSVGVVLFHALTGRLPIEGSGVELLMNKQFFDAVWPSDVQAPQDLVDVCLAMLQRDPDARPTGEEIARRLGLDVGAKPTPARERRSSPGELPFVGRHAALAALRAAYDDVEQGAAVTVFAHGPSGVGKSAVVERFLSELAEDGAIVLKGRCYERELVPYKAVDSVIDALGNYLASLPEAEARALLPRRVAPLARVFPVLRRVRPLDAAAGREAQIPDAQELRRRAFSALRELLSRLSDLQPVVVAIDDVQWGDADSEALLAEVVRPPEAPRILVVACHRELDANRGPFLQAVDDRRQRENCWAVRDLAIEPLSPDEAIELAATQMPMDGEQAAAIAHAVARESDGNPLFVFELARWVSTILAAGREISFDDVSLDGVLWARVEQLPEPWRNLLETIAVAVHPVSASAACAAAGLPPGDRAAVDGLRVERLVRLAESVPAETVEPYHDRVRETVAAHLPSDRLQHRHRSLALALENAEGIDPETLAIHWQAAGEIERAGRLYAHAASHAADALAFDRAARLYARAIDALAADAETVRRLKIERGHALANAGRGAEAAEVYIDVSDNMPGADGRRLRRLAATQLLVSGHVDRGMQVLQDVLAPLGQTIPKSTTRATAALLVQAALARVKGLRFHERPEDAISDDEKEHVESLWAASAGISMVHPILGALFVKKHLRRALAMGERARIVRAVAFEAIYSAIRGPNARRRTEQLLHHARQADAGGDPYLAGFRTLAAGVCAYLEGRWQTAQSDCEKAAQQFMNECVGAVWEIDTAESYCAWSMYHRGAWAEAFATLDVAKRHALDRNDLYLKTNLTGVLEPIFHLARNDPAAAEAVLNDAVGAASHQGFFVQHFLAFQGLVNIKTFHAAGAETWRTVMEKWPLIESGTLLRVHVARLLGWEDVARAALAAARDAAGYVRVDRLRSAQQASRKLHRERAPVASALAQFIDGQIAFLKGDERNALRLLTEAGDALTCVGMQIHAASARHAVGALLGGDKGTAMTRAAVAAAVAQGVVVPRRIFDMFAPGCAEPRI